MSGDRASPLLKAAAAAAAAAAAVAVVRMGCSVLSSRQRVSSQRTSTELKELKEPASHDPKGIFSQLELVNEQGLVLRAYTAQPPPSVPKRGVVVMQHGVCGHAIFQFLVPKADGGAHTELEGSIVGKLLDAGFAIYALDCQGHGLSDAARNEKWFFESFDDLARDFILFTKLVRQREPTQENVFALGVSQGGGIVVNSSLLSPGYVKGLVLMCPMLSLEKLASKPTNRILRPMANFISAFAPRLKVAALEKNKKFPLKQQEMEEDPLCFHGSMLSARVAAENLAFTEMMTRKGGFAKVTEPFITFHAPEDGYVDPDSSKRLVAEAASKDKKFVPAEGMWHALCQEPGKEMIFDAIAEWLKERSL